jgi:hypothetical protein
MSRLVTIGFTREKEVIFANYNVGFFKPILVHVTEHKAKAAIRVRAPAFVGWLHMLSRLIAFSVYTQWVNQQNEG